MYIVPHLTNSQLFAAVVWPKIMGLPMLVFFGLCILIILMLGTFWVLAVQSRNKRAVKGSLYCEFLNKGGNSYNVLLPEANGIIEAPAEHKVPGGRYYVHPKRMFDSIYPPNTWGVIQVPCKKIYFAEGNPEPIDPFEKEPLVTALLLHNSINEKFSQLMLESANELYDKLEDIIKMMKLNPTIIYVGLGLAIALSGAAAYYGFTAAAGIKSLLPPMPK